MRPRPTVYRGIRMRSTLEARTAQVLDAMPGVDWEYEPARYADPTGSCLPDFVVTGAPYPLFIEVKGPPQTTEQRGETLRSLLCVWASVPDARLAIWTPATLIGEPFDVWARGAEVHSSAIVRCGRCATARIVPAVVAPRWWCRACAAGEAVD